MEGLILSYLILSYLILSYLILSYLIISYHIISYHIISYHIISYHSFRPSACLPAYLSVCVSLGLSGQLWLDRSAYSSLLKDKLVFFARSSSSPFFISRSLTVRKKANSVCRWLKFLLFIFLKGHKSCAIIFLNTKSTFLVSLLPHSSSIVFS